MLTAREMILDLAAAGVAVIVVAGYLALLILQHPIDDTYKTMATVVITFYFAQRSGQRAVNALRETNAATTEITRQAVALQAAATNGNKTTTPSA